MKAGKLCEQDSRNGDRGRRKHSVRRSVGALLVFCRGIDAKLMSPADRIERGADAVKLTSHRCNQRLGIRHERGHLAIECKVSNQIRQWFEPRCPLTTKRERISLSAFNAIDER